MGIIGSIILIAFIIVLLVIFGAVGFGGAIMKLLGAMAKKFDEGRGKK